MIYRSKKGVPRDIQEGALSIALTPFHLIVGDVLGNINVIDFLNADKQDEVSHRSKFRIYVCLPVVIVVVVFHLPLVVIVGLLLLSVVVCVVCFSSSSPSS